MTTKKAPKKKAPSKKKHAGGRPTAMTEAVVAKLEAAFSVGATDTEACAHAGINNATYYRRREKDKKFCDKIDRLKEKLPLMAKSKMHGLISSGDKQTVMWYLERKKRAEFGTRQEIDHISTDGSMSPPTKIEIVAPKE
jgi:hypothetical protein